MNFSCWSRLCSSSACDCNSGSLGVCSYPGRSCGYSQQWPPLQPALLHSCHHTTKLLFRHVIFPLACWGPCSPDPLALPEKWQFYTGQEYLIFSRSQAGSDCVEQELEIPSSHVSWRPSDSDSEEQEWQELGQPKSPSINEAERGSFPKTVVSMVELPSTWPVGSLCQDSLCVFINWPYLH